MHGRERGLYIFSQPTILYRCARVVSNLVKNIRTKRLSCLMGNGLLPRNCVYGTRPVSAHPLGAISVSC